MWWIGRREFQLELGREVAQRSLGLCVLFLYFVVVGEYGQCWNVFHSFFVYNLWYTLFFCLFLGVLFLVLVAILRLFNFDTFSLHTSSITWKTYEYVRCDFMQAWRLLCCTVLVFCMLFIYSTFHFGTASLFFWDLNCLMLCHHTPFNVLICEIA